jgi:hypothetical protein
MKRRIFAVGHREITKSLQNPIALTEIRSIKAVPEHAAPAQ